MLPDFPKVKRHARKELLRWTQRQIPNIAPLLKEVGRFTQHEGRSATLVRSDSSEGRMDYPETSFVFELPREEMRTLDLPKLERRLLEMAKQFANAQEMMMFRQLDEATEATGNIVNAGGELRPEHILETIRKVQMSFDPVTGEPQGMAFVVHPSQVEKLMSVWKQWEQDPVFMTQYGELLETKREEWRARESDRRLVD